MFIIVNSILLKISLIEYIMLTCTEPVEVIGNYTNVCCMPLMPGMSQCRIHIKKNPIKIPVEKKKEKVEEKLNEHYLSTELSFDLSDSFEIQFNKIKKFLPVTLKKKIETKYDDDATLTYGDINEIFEALKPKADSIGNKFSLKVFSNALKASGWTEFDKYNDIYYTLKKKISKY